MPNLFSVTAVKQHRQELMDQIDAILEVIKEEKRDPTPEEQSQIDDLLAQVDTIDKEHLPRAEKYEAKVNAKKDADAKQKRQPEPPLDDMGLGPRPRIEGVSRHQPLRNFRGEVNGKPAAERAFEFGHWMLATLSRQVPRYNFKKSIEVCDERGLDIYNVAQTNQNDNAGVFVPETFGMDIVVLREEFGVGRRTVDVVPMDSDTRVDPRWVSGLTAYFVAESASITESDAQWDNVRLVAKDVGALTRMSAQLSADAAINYGDRLVGEIAYAFANLEDTVIFNGDGSSTHGSIRGIRTMLTDVDGSGTDSAGLNVQASGNDWPALVIQDFHDTIGLLPAYALQRGPVWICSSTFYHTVMAPLAIAQAGGATIAEAGASVGSATTGAQFLGFPVVFSQVFPTTTNTDLVSAIFGSMQMGVRMGDRQQESIMFSEHASVGGQSVFERQQIAVRGSERIDVNVFGAGNASDAGPIVGLATGS